MAKQFSWSWSRLEGFETCPKRYYHYNVKKDVVEEESENIRYGNMVHKSLEYRIKRGLDLPLDLRHLEKWIAPIAEAPGKKLTEQKLAINENFELTGWFDGDAWCRVVIDLAIVGDQTAIVIDWKTGKQKNDEGQLDLCAAVMFTALPEIQTIIASYGWTRTKKFTRSVLQREEIPKVWNRLLPRVERLRVAHATTDFPPNPGGLCRNYCQVTSCPHHGGA